MTKQELRLALRENDLPSRLYMRLASAQIARKVLMLPQWKQARTVFIYLSLPQEVDTAPLLQQAWQEGKTVLVPRIGAGSAMDAVPIPSLAGLREGPYGILTPPPSLPAAPPESIHLAIVPCLAAGKDGSRLGHGMGYYDRYLQNTACVKACLCFSRCLREDIPQEAGDVRMDLVITEE